MELLQGYAPLLDISYWFNPRPVPLGPSLVGGVFSFFSWFVVVAVALRVIAHFVGKRDRLKSDVAARFARLLGTSGFLGLLFLFFAFEQIPLFGMRFWFLLLFLLFMVWLMRIALFVVRDYPALRRQDTEKRRFERYLPNRRN